MGRGFVYSPEQTNEQAVGGRRREVQRASRGSRAEAPPTPAPTAEPTPAPEAPPTPAPTAEPTPAPEAPPAPADDYKEKLVKYVPAEVLAFFVPISAFIDPSQDGWLIVVFVAGLIGTLAWLHKANLEVPKEQRAPWWNYVLAAFAFAAWGLATSSATAAVFDLSAESVGIILAVAAFLIPALDFWKSEVAAN